MSRDSDWRLLLPEPVRHLPADLAAVVVLAVATTVAATVPGVRETPLRIILGLPYVLFVPGYALVAALFPEAGDPPAEDDVDDASSREGIDGIERVALSFGLSIAVVPLIGLVLNFTPWGIRLVPILVSVTGITIVLTAVAARRRAQLDEVDRFRVPYRAWIAGARRELFEPESRTDAALNVLLVVSILLAVGSVGYAVAVPGQGEAFTELYLLTETESGELVADDYPTEFTQGETRSLIVGIGNHEHQTVQYTLVSQLQRVEIQNNTTLVRERNELNRYSPTVADNATWQARDTITPTMTGERLRLTYLLYKGSAPPNPTVNSSYREVHLWINVTASQ
ncbi:DUF1616 domain-containing protein [Halobellus rubicundus]|uniref:DUF1616 domain-containing protein n=1 Tax=Halobellus rubicundus TaxID=2996466 RepID=A0ABD5MKA4_9EURY